MRARLLDGELEEVERAADVDVVGGLGRELGARREQGGEVVDLGISYIARSRPSSTRSQMSPTYVSWQSGRRSLVELADVEGDDVLVPEPSASARMSPWPTSPPAPVMRIAELRGRPLRRETTEETRSSREG